MNLPCHPCDIPEAHCPVYLSEEDKIQALDELGMSSDEIDRHLFREKAKARLYRIKQISAYKKRMEAHNLNKPTIEIPKLQNAI